MLFLTVISSVLDLPHSLQGLNFIRPQAAYFSCDNYCDAVLQALSGL